jgi:integrase/recombinase XerD
LTTITPNPKGPLRLATSSSLALSSSRKTIESAAAQYLAARQGAGRRENTLRKISSFRNQLVRWSRAQGLLYVDELDLTQLENFRASWQDAPLTRRVKQGRLRSWMRYCLRHKWVVENFAIDLDPVLVDPKPTLPFSSEEYQRILDAVPELYQAASGFSNQQIQFFKTRLRALIMLLRWSGLRITDALTLRRDRLSPEGRLHLYTAKTGVAVTMLLRPEVTAMLHMLASPNPDYFFWSGRGLPTQVADNYRKPLWKLFRLSGVKGAHPHRFRDTFAIELLLAGVRLEQVSMLLGHSSVKITEKHYLPWVKDRQEQLDASIRRAWQTERPPQTSRLTQ